MNFNAKTILMLLSFLFIALSLNVTLNTTNSFAQNASGMGQTLLDALPQISDLPEGYQFSKREGINNLSPQSAGAYAFRTGKRNYVWTNKDGKSFTQYDSINIAAYANYHEGINDSYAEWSPEKFRANRLTWGDKGHSIKPYQGLPGGVIIEHTRVETSGSIFMYIRLYFWKSRECNGDIYIQYGVSKNDSYGPTQPSFEARAAEGRAFCHTQIERLAKMMYSRLPEGTDSQNVTIDLTAPDSLSETTERSVPEFTPTELAAASSLAGGAALVGALMLMGMSGVGREDIVQAIRDLLRGHVPADSFDAWKQKYEALGWKYNVKNGVATFDPVDGCRNEDGLIWSSQKGDFVHPDAPVEPPSSSAIPKDGDVNERGEVWSSLSGGYVDRKTFDQDLATAQHIKDVNAGINAQPDAVAQDLGSAWVDSRQKLEDMREAGKYVDLSTRLADNFGTTEEKAWCLDFINRHAKAGPDGYQIDPETARQMYSGLKKQMYTSGQISNLAEAQYQTSVAIEVEEKTKVVTQIRDNAARVNRVLAKFDPTGTGGKIVDFQQSVYGAVEGYEKGGLAGAAESAMLTVADNYTQGYATGNYNALKDAYAEQGITDESLAARLAKANFDTANNKYNVLDHVGKAANNILEGEYGAAVDSTLDAFDAKDSLKDDYGKAKDWATGPKADTPDKISVPEANTVPDTTPAGEKSLGTMRRESFEKTRVSFENQTRMMQELNRVADIPDPAQRQAELIRVRNSDPSAYNVVKKELHPDTARVITDANKTLSDQVVERQAKILSEKGFTPEVRLTGKAGGADTDGHWTLKDSDGNVLPESETRKQAEEALKQASDEILEPLGTNADEMGHKIMNDSREKFDADPNALGIESRDGKLVDGKLVTEGHAKTGDHWKDTAAQRATTAPPDRIASEAMTKKNAASLGEVMKTKTEHLDEIARNKGGVTESNMRDMAREITKTDQRTFLAMAQKAGVKPTGEYRDLMQKLKLVSDGDISSDHLPPVREIDRIIAENVGMLKDAIKD